MVFCPSFVCTCEGGGQNNVLMTNMLHCWCLLLQYGGMILQIYGIFVWVNVREGVAMCQRMDVGGVGVFKVILIFITAFPRCSRFHLQWLYPLNHPLPLQSFLCIFLPSAISSLQFLHTFCFATRSPPPNPISLPYLLLHLCLCCDSLVCVTEACHSLFCAFRKGQRWWEQPIYFTGPLNDMTLSLTHSHTHTHIHTLTLYTTLSLRASLYVWIVCRSSNQEVAFFILSLNCGARRQEVQL